MLQPDLPNEEMGQKFSQSSENENTNNILGTAQREMTSQEQGSKVAEALEWEYLDFKHLDKSPIFEVNPMMMKKFIGHNVSVINTSREEFHGCCLAIDPVSLSVILARKLSNGQIRVITVPGYHIGRIYVNNGYISPQESVSVNDLDVAELYHAPSLYSENGCSFAKPNETITDKSQRESQSSFSYDTSEENTNCVSAIEQAPNAFTSEDINKRMNSLHDWLLKHYMPVTINDDILELPSGVKILPPYTVDSCNTKGNQIVKRKISELIKSMPV